MSDNNLVLFFTSGYIDYFKCSFADPKWLTCLTSGRLLPTAFIAGFWGLVKLVSTQWAFFSQFDVPPYEGEYVVGENSANVQVIYYVVDNLFETAWLLVEITVIQAALWASVFSMIVYNIVNGTFVWYGLVGIVQGFAMVLWVTSLFIRLLYNVVNIEWLVSQYDITGYSVITFRDPLTITFSDMNTVEKLVWWEQYLLGNKRTMLYANCLMAFVLSLHPITFVLSWFFMFQIPIQAFLDLIVYPLFPQFDTPYIPWTKWLKYAILGAQEIDEEAKQKAEEDVKDLDPNADEQVQ